MQPKMKHDYAENIKKYATNVDSGAVDGIVKHLGIALRSRDASLVASTDAEEMKRVRESFMKKKLALAGTDAELDAALHEVVGRMKSEHDKSRVTVYYLIAEKFGKLGMFVHKA